MPHIWQFVCNFLLWLGIHQTFPWVALVLAGLDQDGGFHEVSGVRRFFHTPHWQTCYDSRYRSVSVVHFENERFRAAFYHATKTGMRWVQSWSNAVNAHGNLELNYSIRLEFSLKFAGPPLGWHETFSCVVEDVLRIRHI